MDRQIFRHGMRPQYAGPSDMKIGIFTHGSMGAGGIYHYTKNLLDAIFTSDLEHSIVLFKNPGNQLDLSQYSQYPNCSIELFDPELHTTEQEVQEHIGENGFVTRAGFNEKAKKFLTGMGIDLMIYPIAWSFSFECGIPYIVVVHDLQHRIQPEFPEVSAAGEWNRREVLNRNSIRYAEAVFVDSQVGKEDLLAFYGDWISEDKVYLLPYAPVVRPTSQAKHEEIDIRRKYSLPSRFFFYPAQFWEHKNHSRILDAITIIRQKHGLDMSLVLVGSNVGPPHERRELIFLDLVEQARRLGLSDQFNYLGSVPDDDMSRLYRESVGLIMPTFFGPTNIPILEAWALDCPVITSDIRGVRDQAGDAALLVDPKSAEAIAQALYRLWTEPELCNELRKKGAKRLGLFSYEIFRKKLVENITRVTSRMASTEDIAPLTPTLSSVQTAQSTCNTCHILDGSLGRHSIKLHPETVRYANTWDLTGGDTAALENEQMSLVKLFQDLCSEYEQPFIIDVGAHVGTFSLAAALQPDSRGCAFEPLKAACDLLRENLALNGIESRWSVFQKALSNYPGRRILKSPRKDKESGLSCIGQTNYSNYKEEYVDVVRLDDVVSSAGIEAVDIINIDTEGCELFVLIGAAETISKHKPDILISVNWANLNQFDLYLNNLTDYLELIGYHGHWVGPENMVFKHPYRITGGKKPYFADKREIGGLKFAIVKQRYDLFGPWRSDKWDAADPLSVFRKWPSRYLYFEMTHLLQADWFVLPFCHDSKNVRQLLDRHQQTLDDNMEYIRSVDDIPVDDYDVVISLDPILRPPRDSKTLYAYYQNEHHHSEYTHSLYAPLHGYDLFLDHMLKGPAWVYDLPQPVAFPYLRNPDIARKICNGEQADSIWFDKRFIMMLSHGSETFHRGGFEDTISSLEKRLHVQVAFRHADYENVIGWGDPHEYMRAMAACSYYVNLIACGAGQGLCDAASLGLICFGSPKLPYHKVICHPVCLCNDLSELEWKLAMVRGSSDLQQEIRSWQDAALSDVMVTQPLRILQAAVDMKRRRGASDSPGRMSSNSIITEISVGELPEEIARINSTKLKQRAQAEYENGNFEDALHSCKQALWFDKTDYELFYMAALAGYAGKNFKSALSDVTECLKINERFRPAITLQAMLQCEDAVEDDYHKQCRARVTYLIQNRFDGYDKELDGGRIKEYNAILDELLHGYIRQRDSANQFLIQHHKMRLNRIAEL